MGKPMKNLRAKKEREEKRRKEAREAKVLLINHLLDSGAQTKSDLAKGAGISLSTLNKIFKEEKELYKRYLTELRTITDLAQDNMFDIVADKGHPKNYDASKHMLKHFKSDMDQVLDSKDESEEMELEINGSGKSKASPITIRFGKRGDKKE